ncbi:PAP2 domain protein [Thermoascus aurantiacus ATCC 26904]
MSHNGMSMGTGRTVPLSHRPGVAGAAARFWRRSYAADYVALGFLAVGWVLIQLFVHPFHRMFSLDNRAIQFPFAEHERVPVVWSIIYAGFIPLIIILVWIALFRPGTHKAHVTVLGLLATLALTSFVTDVIKNAIGRPRPDLLSRCKPEKGTAEHELVTFKVCTQTNQHILDEGWRSFPSGHSSFAFGGLGYLSLFFAGQMHAFRPRVDLARFLLCLAPLLGASMIAISRWEDYRHDVYDVTSGSILGMLVAYFTYRRYYPSPWSIRCDVPYDKSDADGFSKLADDEEQQAQEGLMGRDWRDTEEAYGLAETPAARGRS